MTQQIKEIDVSIAPAIASYEGARTEGDGVETSGASP